MRTSKNRYDPIEQIIFDEKLLIKDLVFKQDSDLLLVYLNTNQFIALPLSSFKTLAKAKPQALNKFELISNGLGVHWPKLDEDLSLKGFLKAALENFIKSKRPAFV